jgi:hypothetical protein
MSWCLHVFSLGENNSKDKFINSYSVAKKKTRTARDVLNYRSLCVPKLGRYCTPKIQHHENENGKKDVFLQPSLVACHALTPSHCPFG